MCGICGEASPNSRARPDESVLRRMCRSLAHRGPDDEGIHLGEGVGLGARRLSIIDLAGGHQPIANEDGTVRVVFNGEIYNYRQLRGLLEKLGHRFSTRSDTETIVHAYEEFGDECAKYLNGIFAFAVWDEPRPVQAQTAFGKEGDRDGKKTGRETVRSEGARRKTGGYAYPQRERHGREDVHRELRYERRATGRRIDSKSRDSLAALIKEQFPYVDWPSVPHGS